MYGFGQENNKQYNCFIHFQKEHPVDIPMKSSRVKDP